MHTIQFTPQRRDDTRLTYLAWTGDVLSINGEALDLTGVPEGATLPGSAVDHPLVEGDISRTGGFLSLSLVLPLGTGAPEAARFPTPVKSNGAVAIPETHPEPAP